MTAIWTFKVIGCVFAMGTSIYVCKKIGAAWGFFIGFPLIFASDSDLSSIRSVAFTWFPRSELWQDITLNNTTFNALVLVVMSVCCPAICVLAHRVGTNTKHPDPGQ